MVQCVAFFYIDLFEPQGVDKKTSSGYLAYEPFDWLMQTKNFSHNQNKSSWNPTDIVVNYL